MKAIGLILTLFLLVFGIAGCTKAIDDSGDVGIRGLITTVSLSDNPTDIMAAILVEGTAEENAGLVSDKASITLTKDTVLVVGSEKKYFELADLDKLAIGVKVEVVFTGPVAESYPVQGSAKVLRIIDGSVN